jgi:hypothetical protein
MKEKLNIRHYEKSDVMPDIFLNNAKKKRRDGGMFFWEIKEIIKNYTLQNTHTHTHTERRNHEKSKFY